MRRRGYSPRQQARTRSNEERPVTKAVAVENAEKRTAAAAWAITIGLATLLGLLLGWRVGVGTVAAILLYGGCVQLVQVLKGQ